MGVMSEMFGYLFGGSKDRIPRGVWRSQRVFSGLTELRETEQGEDVGQEP